ncbi:receptor-type tyrosine-protein phosphatase eta [Ornithorhynchus anatinus]|uniref:receptor-type tyrosine-protein phosphatase eta n=1 Tax=Ornithorhynchus anatinus TaxID=9258 RepID=UPI0010A8D8DC|nr:receptor-type tyrosine-protein phosphatase eta [Ornithorhynchus anatinus]
MSPGKPGAGETPPRRRRRRGRRRRRRRRPQPGPATTKAAAGGAGPRLAGLPGRLGGMKLGSLLGLLLLLHSGQMRCAGVYSPECSPMALTSTTTEIHISDLPLNFSATNVTDLNGEQFGNRLEGDFQNITVLGLRPGAMYLIQFENGTDTCWQKYSTKPSRVFGIEVTCVEETEVSLIWKNNDTAASTYNYIVKVLEAIRFKGNQTFNATIRDLKPGTFYTIRIIPETNDGIQGSPVAIDVTTKPSPVFDVHHMNVGPTEVSVVWRNSDSAVSMYQYRMFIEENGIANQTSPNMQINITDLKHGFQCWAIIVPLEGNEANENIGPSTVTNSTDVNVTCQKDVSTSVTPEGDQAPQLTRVNVVGLKPSTQYTATIFSQEANGTEGNPVTTEIWTNMSQIIHVQTVNVTASEVSLTWENKDNSSSAYSYRILVEFGNETSFNASYNLRRAVITGLNSSTLYKFTVYPQRQGFPEGLPNCTEAYTAPQPVSDFQVTNISTTEIGLAWTSSDSTSFRILITEHISSPRNETFKTESVVIRELEPGTTYTFELFPQIGTTEGASKRIRTTTKPSAVFDIQVVGVNTTTIELEWKNNDTASDTYLYHLLVNGDGFWNLTSLFKNASLTGLSPGTPYNITIFPEVKNQTEGRSNSTVVYTRPSKVFGIEVLNVATTEMTLRWQNQDNASAAYTYRICIENNETARNETSNVPSVNITGLSPGTSYTFRVVPQAGDHFTEGEPVTTTSKCTVAAPLPSFWCEPVPKQPALILKWNCPPGTNTGFKMEVIHGDWRNETHLPACHSPSVTNVTLLNYATLYNISVTTQSCGNESIPREESCLTDITDPPEPVEPPNVISVSHNSLKVKFSGFKATNGPIKAYAVILTTGEGNPHKNVLNYSYEDFKKKESNTYVTYFIEIEGNRASVLSDDLKYEVEVGNESTTGGYFNGRLEPLSSYRTSIAGFTKFNFSKQGRIEEEESYVSFTPFSNAVSLPQDPGVICGAVFGCIFGALVVVAVGGFIFWRRKRKYAKNNEVSFSQIKPKKSKLIKVENFESYFKKQQADSNCGFAEEYEDLKLVGVNQPKYAAEMTENRGKNRYNNVLPYDISRVKLSIQNHMTDDYINANYMPGYHSKKDFIATQGPLPNTLDDFWRMVWEKNIYSIVMLTKCVEQGRTKCEEYWPSKQAQHYGEITVAMTSEIVLPEWTIRDFTVKNSKTNEGHPLRQFHFTSWPDHGVPETTDLLINFRYLVHDFKKQNPPECPVLVHCSAGVGRTGTFIAIDRLIYQMENENNVDVYGIVYDLRMHRPLMVQTEDQYVFLNQCVWDIIKSQKDSKTDLIYQNTTAMTIYENLTPVTTFGKTNGFIA